MTSMLGWYRGFMMGSRYGSRSIVALLFESAGQRIEFGLMLRRHEQERQSITTDHWWEHCRIEGRAVRTDADTTDPATDRAYLEADYTFLLKEMWLISQQRKELRALGFERWADVHLDRLSMMLMENEVEALLLRTRVVGVGIDVDPIEKRHGIVLA